MQTQSWIFHFPTKAPLHHSHPQTSQLILTTIRVISSHLFTTPLAYKATSPLTLLDCLLALNDAPAFLGGGGGGLTYLLLMVPV